MTKRGTQTRQRGRRSRREPRWQGFARTSRGAGRRVPGGRWLAALAGCAIVAIALGGALLVYSGRGGSGGPPRAVIIDQLAATDPNPSFVRSASDMLVQAGYQVDYVPSGLVSVDFYASLPERGYSFIIIRSHSYGIRQFHDPRTGQTVPIHEVGLFTSEPYSKDAHLPLQLGRDVDRGVFNGATQPVFGIAPKFVHDDMSGHFAGTTLVIMGCDGLSSTSLAQAFRARGIKQVIGWDSQVTAAHTDDATLQLLDAMLIRHEANASAVADVSARVGPDPVYGGRLTEWP